MFKVRREITNKLDETKREASNKGGEFEAAADTLQQQINGNKALQLQLVMILFVFLLFLLLDR
jgi:hypothetical protein